MHIFRSQFLGTASHYEHLRILNYGLELVRLALLFQFDADFADIFEVRGTKRERKGESLTDHVDGSAAILAYKGLDGVFRRTRLEFSPHPTSLTTREALFRITLEPKQETSIYTTVACQRDASTNGVVPFQTAFRALKRESERAAAKSASITTSSESFNAWLHSLLGRSSDADRKQSRGPLSVCGSALVQHRFWARRNHYRARMPLDLAADRGERSEISR